jgi:hypothetical protein
MRYWNCESIISLCGLDYGLDRTWSVLGHLTKYRCRQTLGITGLSDAPFQRQYNDGGWRAHVTEQG